MPEPFGVTTLTEEVVRVANGKETVVQSRTDPNSVVHVTASLVADAQPAVFFCSAGKDRTGVLAALLLAILGVPDAEIVADYALTGEVVSVIIERFRPGEVPRTRPSAIRVDTS